MTISACINIYNDNNALPGWLENVSSWADEIFCIHAGPNGKASTDGTMETLEKWGIKPVMADVFTGFGNIRTRLVKECKSDWAFIMDADERFYPVIPIFDVEGTESFPSMKNPNVRATIAEPAFNQMERLREVMRQCTSEHGAIKMIRRHWFGFDMKRPTQNWNQIPDWQMRFLQRKANVGFDSSVKIHERCIDLSSDREPITIASNPRYGPFVEHQWTTFKGMEPEQRLEDIAIYDALHAGVSKEMWAGQV